MDTRHKRARCDRLHVARGYHSFDLRHRTGGRGLTENVSAILRMGPAGELASSPAAGGDGCGNCRPSIRGGRAHLRQALYLQALVAVRFNAAMKAKYQALPAAGKPPKVALAAMMRKLIILANALIRDGRTWSPLPP
jgi:hypothetical protein